MAIIKAVSSKAGIKTAINYVTRDEKTDQTLLSGLHCEPDTAADEMQATKLLWGKTGGRTYKHFVQSYHANERITPERAHKNAVELAESTQAWRGFEVLIATHKDREHIHTHFIVNSVSYEDGHKLRWSKADLQDLKKRCNAQSREQGLHVPQKGKTYSGEDRDLVAWKKNSWQFLKEAEQKNVISYVRNIARAVIECSQSATTREEFCQMMAERGYRVDWQDNHKYITFIDVIREIDTGKRSRIRNNKLEQYYNMNFGKEALESLFERNVEERQYEKSLEEKSKKREVWQRAPYIKGAQFHRWPLGYRPALTDYQRKRIAKLYRTGQMQRYKENEIPMEYRPNIVQFNKLVAETNYILSKPIRSEGDVVNRMSEIQQELKIIRRLYGDDWKPQAVWQRQIDLGNEWNILYSIRAKHYKVPKIKTIIQNEEVKNGVKADGRGWTERTQRTNNESAGREDQGTGTATKRTREPVRAADAREGRTDQWSTDTDLDAFFRQLEADKQAAIDECNPDQRVKGSQCEEPMVKQSVRECRSTDGRERAGNPEDRRPVKGIKREEQRVERQSGEIEQRIEQPQRRGRSR